MRIDLERKCRDPYPRILKMLPCCRDGRLSLSHMLSLNASVCLMHMDLLFHGLCHGPVLDKNSSSRSMLLGRPCQTSSLVPLQIIWRFHHSSFSRANHAYCRNFLAFFHERLCRAGAEAAGPRQSLGAMML